MKTSTTYEPSSDQTELLPVDNAPTETEEVTTSEVTDSSSETDFSEDPLPASEPETPALNAEGKASGDTTGPASTADPEPEPEPESKRRKRGFAWIPLGIAAGLVAGALCVGLTLGAGAADPVSAITGVLPGSISEEEQAAGTSSTTSDGAPAATSAAEEDAAAASTKATADETLEAQDNPSASDTASGTKTAGKDSGTASVQEGASGKAAPSGKSSSGTSAGTTSDKTAATGTGSSTSSTSKPNAGSDSTAAGTQSTPATGTSDKTATGSSENTATTAPAATPSSETSTASCTHAHLDKRTIQTGSHTETVTDPNPHYETVHHDAEYNDWNEPIEVCNICGETIATNEWTHVDQHILETKHNGWHSDVLYHHDLVRDAYDEEVWVDNTREVQVDDYVTETYCTDCGAVLENKNVSWVTDGGHEYRREG